MDVATMVAVGTPAAIAVLVAIITWGQWRTNRARLRHELFDRRYKIYAEIAAFLVGVLQSGRVEPGGDSEFLRQTKQAYFAFGGDVAIRDLVDEIYQHAVQLQTLQAKEVGLSGAALNSNLNRQTEVKQWFQAALNSLEPRFEKYLRLRH
jgi:hypothetical protein